jgi:hypothetical protein
MECLVIQIIDRAPSKALPALPLLPATRAGLSLGPDRRDTPAVLAATLGPVWSVHREVDYEGDVSTIVLPNDGYVAPAFALYEKDGLVRVATVDGDEWINDESFPGIYIAMTAIIAKTLSIAAARQAGVEAATQTAAE